MFRTAIRIKHSLCCYSSSLVSSLKLSLADFLILILDPIALGRGSPTQVTGKSIVVELSKDGEERKVWSHLMSLNDPDFWGPKFVASFFQKKPLLLTQVYPFLRRVYTQGRGWARSLHAPPFLNQAFLLGAHGLWRFSDPLQSCVQNSVY